LRAEGDPVNAGIQNLPPGRRKFPALVRFCFKSRPTVFAGFLVAPVRAWADKRVIARVPF